MLGHYNVLVFEVFVGLSHYNGDKGEIVVGCYNIASQWPGYEHWDVIMLCSLWQLQG